jgi:hypothetical protein
MLPLVIIFPAVVIVALLLNLTFNGAAVTPISKVVVLFPFIDVSPQVFVFCLANSIPSSPVPALVITLQPPAPWIVRGLRALVVPIDMFDSA